MALILKLPRDFCSKILLVVIIHKSLYFVNDIHNISLKIHKMFNNKNTNQGSFYEFKFKQITTYCDPSTNLKLGI